MNTDKDTARKPIVQTDNVNIRYLTDTLGTEYVQTWYTVHLEFSWQIVKREFDSLRKVKTFIKKFAKMNTGKYTTTIVEHTMTNRVIEKID